MTDERERSWRAAGERARLALVRSTKPSGMVMALRDVEEKITAAVADAARFGRAMKLREVATKLRDLNRIVEHDCGCDGYKLRMLAAHYEYVADNIDPRR